MSSRFLMILTLALGACSTVPTDALPVCDGRDRRPANPQGSMLAAPRPIPATPDPATDELLSPGGCA